MMFAEEMEQAVGLIDIFLSIFAMKVNMHASNCFSYV